jgi:hypothetical protein
MEDPHMPANNNSIMPALPRALPRDARRKVETAIEQHLAAVQALTAFLDEADGDSDLEPYLAGGYAPGEGDDREGDPADPPEHTGIDDNELDVSYNEGHGRGGSAGTDSEDEEHSLGWPERANQAAAVDACKGSYSFGGGQWGWQMAGDAEPSLGSQGPEVDQTHWAHGDRREMEEQCEDEGFDSDSEPDIEADREPPMPPFELDQTDWRSP